MVHLRPPRSASARRSSRRLVGSVLLAGVLLSGACTDDEQFDATRDGSSGSALPAATVAELREALDQTMAEYEVPGAVAGVYVPGEGEWVTAAGVADLDSGEEMTTDLVWPIRSITKSFTVTVLLQLVDEGLVSLDDTLDQWVPEMANADRITLGQLADMTSGVAEYTNDAFIEAYVADPQGAFTTEDLIGFAAAGVPSSEPGAEHLYINTSTVLLGEVIEQVTGEPFGEVVSERILGPVSMEETTYPTTPDGWTGPHATGYQPDDGELVGQDNNFTVFNAAGAMTSTLDDLRAWGPVLATGSLLEPETQRQRLVGSPLDEGPEYDNYAYGIGELDGWWGHTGEGFGITALVMHQADNEATVVILMNLSNNGDHVPTKLFRRFAEVLDD